jgi:hypothetical protein
VSLGTRAAGKGKKTWPGRTGWAPYLLGYGMSMLVSLVYALSQNSSPPPLLLIVLGVTSSIFLAIAAVLIREAQRAWRDLPSPKAGVP